MKNDDNIVKKEEKVRRSHDNKEKEELKVKIEELEGNYKRALADYQNLQRRVAEDRSEWIRTANKELLLRILTVYDTLVLAVAHTQDKSIEVSINQFNDVLKAEGVTKIKTVGEEFNPHLMEAVASEEAENDKVIAELRAGFLIHDKLLRPAQVKVGNGLKN